MSLTFASTGASLRGQPFAIVLILLLAVYGCNATVIISGQQYLFKHVEGRKGCANEGVGVFMAYLNKTCSAGATGTSYGNTVGPLLRAASTGNSWRQFTLTKVGTTAQKEDLVEIETYYPKSSKKPLCQGFVVPEKKDACTVEPLANKVHIHAKKGTVWALSSVKGKKDTYTIRSYLRKPRCLKFLAVSAACDEPYLQLDAKDDGSGRQHWIITPVKISSSAPPPRRISPPSLAKFAEVPALNYSIALTGYNSASFNSSSRAAFCNSILSSRNYPQDWMNCIVSSVTDVPLQGDPSGQSNSVYVRGLTDFRFVYNDIESQQQAKDAADGLYKDMASQDSLQNIFQSSFPSSTLTLDSVNREEVQVPQSTLPTTPSSPSPSSPLSPAPSSPTPYSPTPMPSPPTPSSATLSPEFSTVPDNVFNEGPVTSPSPSGGGGGGGSGGSGGGGGGGGSGSPPTPPPRSALYTTSSLLGTGNTGIQYGAAVDMSANGNVAVITDPWKIFRTGEAFVVSRTSPTTWGPRVLLPNNPYFSGYGSDVAINGDGTQIVVGTASLFTPGNVYVYTTNTGSSWALSTVFTGSGDSFGQYLASSDDGHTIVVGAITKTFQSVQNAGEVSLMTYNTGSSAWSAVTPIAGGNANAKYCGGGIDISGDGQTIAVGCYKDNGEAYVIDRTPTGWGTPFALKQYANPATAVGANFGKSIGISKDGSVVVVGAPNANSQTGDAYIFTRAGAGGTAWIGLAPSFISLGPLVAPDLAANDQFGSSVAISGDGTKVAVGAGVSTSVSAVYVFTKSGTSWVYSETLSVATAQSLGSSLSISNDGKVILAGADATNGTGDAFVFDY